MKAIAIQGTDSASSLSRVDVPAPEPMRGQVRVRVHASSVNPADIKVVRWEGPARFLHAKVDPLVPGYDLSGVVDGVGSGVDDLSEGEAVFGHLAYSGQTRQGAFAEQVTIDASQVAKKPEGVDHATAAASATVGLTALQALRDEAHVSKGARVLILGASGGVGSLAVGIAKRLGAEVTGVCSGYAVDFVRDLGADVVVNRREADPLSHTTVFDAVFDTTGLYAYGACKHLLTGEGAFITTLPSLSFLLGKLSAMVSSRRCAVVVVRSRRADLEQLGRWLDGGLNVSIAETFAVRDAGAALARVADGGHLGKIALDVLGGL